MIRGAFANQTEVTAHFAGAAGDASAWVEQRGGRFREGVAQFTVERPAEIAGLLDAASRAGLEVADLSLRRPNLESLFLKLTGRELRD